MTGTGESADRQAALAESFAHAPERRAALVDRLVAEAERAEAQDRLDPSLPSTDHPLRPADAVFTDAERGVVVQALHDLLAETERYVANTAPGADGHDSCCDAVRGRRASIAVTHANLQERERLVRSALTKMGEPT